MPNGRSNRSSIISDRCSTPLKILTCASARAISPMWSGRLRMNLTPGGAGFRDVLGECLAPCVLVADELPPSIAAQLDWTKFQAFITNAGSRTYHTAILARSLHVPAVVGLHDATEKIAPGTMILVDGQEGTVSIDPPPERIQSVSSGRTRRLKVRRNADQVDGSTVLGPLTYCRWCGRSGRRERRSARRCVVCPGAGRRRHRAVPIGAVARGPSGRRADRRHAARHVLPAAG